MKTELRIIAQLRLAEALRFGILAKGGKVEVEALKLGSMDCRRWLCAGFEVIEYFLSQPAESRCCQNRFRPRCTCVSDEMIHRVCCLFVLILGAWFSP